MSGQEHRECGWNGSSGSTPSTPVSSQKNVHWSTLAVQEETVSEVVIDET